MGIGITSLWLPILVSSVFVFIASSIIHMVLKYHANDFKPLPGEDQVMDALRKFNIPPGEYAMPRAGSMKEMGEPAFKEKYRKGPVGFLTIFPAGEPGMGKELVLWFLYSVLVGIFAAYVAGRALDAHATYLAVHRFAGVTAFAAYGLGNIPASIWYKRSWGNTVKALIDALIYGSITGGTFGWLWPHGM